MEAICQCGHQDGAHYKGGECMEIEGEDRCGCEFFIEAKPREE